MPYIVLFSKEDNIVYATVSGHATKNDHFAARDEALRLCKEHGCSRILIDLHDLQCSSLSTMDSFSFGEDLAKSPHFIRLAHVLPQHAQARENIIFASTVAANRGKPGREFETIEDAKNWLLDETCSNKAYNRK